MKKKNVEFLSNLIVERIYSKIIFEERDFFQNENLTYDKSLLKRYISYDLNHESYFIDRSNLGLTFLDETMLDELENEEFFIATDKMSSLLLQIFKESVPVDRELFTFIRCGLKNLDLSLVEEQEYESALHKIEDYALSEVWRLDFAEELAAHKIMQILCNPCIYITQTLVHLWVTAVL
jgi:hypothetical protein